MDMLYFPYILSQGHWLTLELTDAAGPADWRALDAPSPPFPPSFPQLQRLLTCAALCRACWESNPGPHVSQALTTEHVPQNLNSVFINYEILRDLEEIHELGRLGRPGF